MYGIRKLVILLAATILLAGCGAKEEIEQLKTHNRSLSQDLNREKVNREKSEIKSKKLEKENEELRAGIQAYEQVVKLVSEKNYEDAYAICSAIDMTDFYDKGKYRDTIATTTTYILGALVGGSLLAMFLTVILVVFTHPSRLEIGFRLVSIVIGFLAYFGVKFSGGSATIWLLPTLRAAPTLEFIGYGVVGPLFLGLVVCWYVSSMLKRNDNLPSRAAIIFGIFALAMAIDFFLAVCTSSFENKLFTPNLAFTIGVGLFMILRFDPRRTPSGFEL